MSVEPFNRLVKLAARAFYDDITLKGDNQPKNGRSDNRGMAVVILDSLTRCQWVREDDLAKDLRLHSKQLRRTLRFFEEEKFISRDSRKETAKGVKIYNQAVAATADGQQVGKDGEEKTKLHVHSYCCLDYAQIFDVVRYRIHRMKKKLKDELDSRNTIQEYICPNCSRRYSALDALQLISPNDEYFHCENCNGELVAESDKLAAEEMGDGDDNARKRRREKLKDMLQRIEVQLKPLVEQLQRVKDLTPPDYGNLQAWEVRNAAALVRNGDSGVNDSLKSSQGQGYGGTPMPLLGDTKVEVDLFRTEVKEEDSKPDTSTTDMKILPPWMIKQGMNLTKQQRGEVKQEAKDASMVAEATDDKKSKVDDQDDQKRIQDEFLKAYYAAILERQKEEAKKEQQEKVAAEDAGVSETTTDRRIGEKSKREEEGEDDIEWEEPSAAGNTADVRKVNDLNLQADGDDDDDDDDDGIDWEEG
ncbi:hypothetical protein H6P81_003696 [Aristolochia fimbriata]|uniref:HTH TFE/IIEalpha-type domain-containing protein n=1 Tax=Aristolochia fimbriata TaxID=158543 RepID=A0AAV7FDJ3_ARIFI|nr:hypothetical protein H6P81_003696 [Aristolochia fimbriata]